LTALLLWGWLTALLLWGLLTWWWARAQVWDLAGLLQLIAITTSVLFWVGLLNAQIAAHLLNLNLWCFPFDDQVAWILGLLSASLLVHDASLLVLVWQPLLDQDVLWLSWQVGQLFNDHTSSWWVKSVTFDLNDLFWDSAWLLWWHLTVHKWWWSACTVSFLSQNHWWCDIGGVLLLADDQITWLWGSWWLQVLDGDLLGVLELIQSLLDHLWVWVLVDFDLLNWDLSTVLVDLTLVQVDTGVLAGLELLGLVGLDWLLGVDHLLFDLRVELLATARCAGLGLVILAAHFLFELFFLF